MSDKVPVKVTGLVSHDLWMKTRLVDIKQAIKRFEDANKPVPECWREELEALKLEIEAAK